jgi:peptidoglycan/xylan/chitin deacetylase (PgdA/CDA1 family)
MIELDWTPLREEFAKWRTKRLVLPIWWRDDDAVDGSDQLDRLIDLSREVEVPVHLAIIPREAKPALVERIRDEDHIFPIVHGWGHRNQAAPGEDRSEFSINRPLADNKEEAQEALRKLRLLLPGKVLPVFVPPWNHIDDELLGMLADLGYKVLSTCDPRTVEVNEAGLKQINTQLDPIAWRDNEQLHAQEYITGKLLTNLKRRRQGKDDNGEPFGLLTHHRAMNEDVWDFTRQFWQEMRNGPTRVVGKITS